MEEINKFLKRFHDYPTVDEVFTQGCCYWFAFILHSRFPDSTIMYDQVNNHYMVSIKGRLYDITGDVTDLYPRVEEWEAIDDSLLRQRLERDCINF